ncbi:MAG: FkbM family methyltransferase [Chthoniobacterales bacterium]
MLERARQELRSLFDQPYRRAFRNLRNLPRREYATIVDVGANRGAFTDAFLLVHRPQRIVLVEAIAALAEKLEARYGAGPGVSVVSAALSDQSGTAPFELNRSEGSSSLLPIDPRNADWFGLDLRVVRTLQVRTVTLPELMQEENLTSIDLLKLDVQGAERFVLTGGAAVLDRVGVIYTEVFFEPLYEGAWLFGELTEFLTAHRFKLCGLSNIVHAVDNGDLLQANATFRRI